MRIAESFRLARAVQDGVWPQWSEAPFALLLFTPEQAFLVHHPQPPEDFRPAGYDSLLQSDVHVRDRVLPPNLQATFPLGGVPTVVIGQPEQTEQASTSWVLTVLHEHFHQWQMARPGYFAAVDSLGLSGGDDTGQWMLNYPFPYDSASVEARFADMQAALLRALRAREGPEFERHRAAFYVAKNALQSQLSAADYRYLSFQLWQEGVARYVEYYVEYKAAQAAAERYAPTAAFRALEDAVPFAAAADSLYRQIERGLEQRVLSKDRRLAFYPVGAAEALVLDRTRPGWRSDYFEHPFYLERYAHPHPSADSRP